MTLTERYHISQELSVSIINEGTDTSYKSQNFFRLDYNSLGHKQEKLS
jgi:hypothetical protein